MQHCRDGSYAEGGWVAVWVGLPERIVTFRPDSITAVPPCAYDVHRSRVSVTVSAPQKGAQWFDAGHGIRIRYVFHADSWPGTSRPATSSGGLLIHLRSRNYTGERARKCRGPGEEGCRSM